VGLFKEQLAGDFIVFLIESAACDKYADGHRLNLGS
jgi:hypothetical protein